MLKIRRQGKTRGKSTLSSTKNFSHMYHLLCIVCLMNLCSGLLSSSSMTFRYSLHMNGGRKVGIHNNKRQVENSNIWSNFPTSRSHFWLSYRNNSDINETSKHRPTHQWSKDLWQALTGLQHQTLTGLQHQTSLTGLQHQTSLTGLQHQTFADAHHLHTHHLQHRAARGARSAT